MAFSRRSTWPAERNRLSRVLEEKRHSGRRVLDLTESNPTRAGLDYPTGELLAALSQPASLLYEPQPQGLLTAREAVARYYRDAETEVDPSRIVLTCSTSEAYAHLFRLLADPGDNFLVPRPSYPLFEYLAGLEGVELRGYRLFYDAGWYIDFQSLEEAMTASSRAIILVNPNNPTGSFVKGREWERLCAIAADRDMALIVDEVFSDYALEPDPDSLVRVAGEQRVVTFVLNGLSKIAALPQMKLGWIIAGGPPTARDNALERLELIADTFLSVGTPLQHAAAVLLESRRVLQPQIQQRLVANLHSARTILAQTAAQVLAVEGGWYAVVRLPRTRSEEDWTVGLLRERDVLLHPGYFFDFPSEAFVVCSLLTPTEVFAEGLTRLKSCMAAVR